MFSDVTPEISPRKSLSLLPVNRLPQAPEEQAFLLDALIVQSRNSVLIAESDVPDLSCFRVYLCQSCLYAIRAGSRLAWADIKQGPHGVL